MAQPHSASPQGAGSGGSSHANLRCLVDRACKGNPKAFSELYSIYYSRTYNTAYKILHNQFAAEEVAQESFLYLFTKFDSLREPEHFENWFFSIVYCRSMDRLRKDKRSTSTVSLDVLREDDGDTLKSLYSEFSPQKSLEVKEDYDLLLQLIAELTTLQRTTLILFYNYQLSTHEIAELLDVSVATIDKRLHDARASIKSGFGCMVRAADRQIRADSASASPC